MGKKLSEEEIDRRLVKLRNLERLHEQDQVIKAGLRAEIKELKDRLEAKIEAQAVLIAELQKKVFGSKRPRGGSGGFKESAKTSAKPRNETSYRRALPDPGSVTSERKLLLEEKTCACSGVIQKTRPAVRFVEDIPLPRLTAGYQARLVTEYLIERGVCLACGKTKVAQNWNLGGQPVSLGKNLRLLVCHLVSSGLSYAKTRQLLQTLYGIEVSSGEIAAILKKAHRSWQPAYGSLLKSIRASPAVHIDETPLAGSRLGRRRLRLGYLGRGGAKLLCPARLPGRRSRQKAARRRRAASGLQTTTPLIPIPPWPAGTSCAGLIFIGIYATCATTPIWQPNRRAMSNGGTKVSPACMPALEAVWPNRPTRPRFRRKSMNCKAGLTAC